MKQIAVFLVALLFAPSASAQPADWQKVWVETLAAAKNESKVVIIGSPDPVMRNEIIPAFQKRYGITVEYIAVGSSGQASGRIRTERQSGIYSVDVFLSGLGTTGQCLLPGEDDRSAEAASHPAGGHRGGRNGSAASPGSSIPRSNTS